jgi:hypothetical protein
VTVYFDDDSSGRGGTRDVVDALMPYMPVRVILGAPGDAAELSGDDIRSLIADAEPALEFAARGGLD